MIQRINFENTMFAFTALGAISFIGGALLLANLDFERVSKSSNAPFWLLPTFLTLLCCIGFPMALFRRGVTVIPHLNQIITWWGFVIPLKKLQCSISDFKEIELIYETEILSSSTDGGKPSYVYRIYFINDNRKLPITHSSKRRKSEANIEKLQKVTPLKYAGFIDSTESTPKNLPELIKQAFSVLSGKSSSK